MALTPLIYKILAWVFSSIILLLPILVIRKNDLNLSYIYKVEFGNDVWFLPSINVGFSSKNLNPAKS